jgi:hypothetical protein
MTCDFRLVKARLALHFVLSNEPPKLACERTLKPASMGRPSGVSTPRSFRPIFQLRAVLPGGEEKEIAKWSRKEALLRVVKSRAGEGMESRSYPPLLISRDFRLFSRESDFCALVSGLPMFGRPGSGCSAMEESEGEIRSWPVGSLEELADAKIGGDEKRKGGPRNRTAFLVRLVAEMGAQRVAPRQAIGVV